MKRSAVSFAAVLILGLMSTQTQGGVTLYTSRAAFDAATTGVGVIDFAGLATSDVSSYFGNPGSLTVENVSFEAPNGPLFVQNDGVASRLTIQQGTPFDLLQVALPGGITAVGFDYESGTGFTLTLASGESFELPVVRYPIFEFAGFTTDQPIDSFSMKGGGDLMNFTFGAAVPVPEPASAFLFGLGGIGLTCIGLRVRRTPAAP